MYQKKRFTLLIIILVYTGSLFAQEFNPYIQEKVDQLSYDTLYLRLQQFEDFGIKEIESQNLNNTGNWIINLYQQYGYSDIEIDSFYVGQNLVYNIIITKTGTIYPDTYLIVDGHYDTYNGPGVNDNGSGTATILEIARIMVDVETEYSIKFIHFTAEEIGLVGSNHYVNNVVIPQDMNILLVFNIDGVGGVAGEVNNTITCERDQWEPYGNNAASAAFTDTLANLTEMYADLLTQISFAYGSDYVPFMLNGYVVTGLYETNESPYNHTINDNLSNLDAEYVFEVAKASLAATLYYSKGESINSIIALNQSNKSNFSIYPNPFIDYVMINNSSGDDIIIRLYDLTGRLVFESSVESNSEKSFIPDCDHGIYLISISSMNGKLIYKDKIIKL